MNPDSDTVTTRLTGKGRAAVATVLVAGPQSVDLVLQFFRNAAGKSLPELPINAIRFGTWLCGHTAEELVVCRTATDRVEIHCHGGHFASRRIIACLVTAGASEINAEQWLAQQSGDRFCTEAIRLLASSRTERTTAILLDQLRGAMRRELLRIQSFIDQNQFHLAADHLNQIISYGELGQRLAVPWSVVLVGPPNVGKSSLINCLLGYNRSIVFDQPGTTRDLVSAETAIDGWPVALTDTAGLRDSVDAVESAGVRLAKEQLAEADLVVFVHDLSKPRGISHGTLDLQEAITKRMVHVGSKADISPTSVDTDMLPTSAVTLEGIDILWQVIAAKLVPSAPPTGAGVPLNSQLVGQLRQIRESLENKNVATATSLLRDAMSR